LAGDASFRPAINIISDDLHAGDIRQAMGEIASYHKKGWFSLVHAGCMSFSLSLAFLLSSV
jgi:hypothetical protein